MRWLIGGMLAVLMAGPASAFTDGDAGVAASLAAVPAGCAVTTTATIVAYDLARTRTIAYRFVRSDGSASTGGSMRFAGAGGAAAQSVSDTWVPRGATPWVALEISGGANFRSRNVSVGTRCARPDLAKR